MHLTSRPGTLISTYIARAPITARPGLGLGHRAEPVFLVPGLRSQHSQLRQGCSISTQRLASLMVKGAKKHFYAVHTGRQTGIYKTWSECQQQIDGMKGAVYKGFVTLPEAQAFVQGPGYQPKAVSTPGAGTAGRSKAAGTATLTKHQRKAPRPEKGPAQPLGPPLLVESYSIQPAEKYRLEFDGGSRGNPGPAGAGAALYEVRRNSLVGMLRTYLPKPATNNVAEYTGLIDGLKAAKLMGVQHIEIAGDSLLVVNQLTKEWKVNHTAMKRLHAQATKLMTSFLSHTARHIFREHNGQADALANEAMDCRSSHLLQDAEGVQWPGQEALQESASAAPDAALDPTDSAELSDDADAGSLGQGIKRTAASLLSFLYQTRDDPTTRQSLQAAVADAVPETLPKASQPAAGRKRKASSPEASPVDAVEDLQADDLAEPVSVKRRRGRPKKPAAAAPSTASDSSEQAQTAPKRQRGRPRKAALSKPAEDKAAPHEWGVPTSKKQEPA